MSSIRIPSLEGLKKAREAFKKSYTPAAPSDDLVEIVEEATKESDRQTDPSVNPHPADDGVAARGISSSKNLS